MSINEKTHRCIEKRLKQNCPVCLDDLFSSTKGISFLPCHHAIHSSCFQEMIKNKSFKCPLCNKLMLELDNELLDLEIQNTPMPDEYKDLKVNILCNECQCKSECLFHIYGFKCSNCKSYNTSRI
jgi:RING finger and CHY zinc finger domain-containing protein 1